MEEVLQQVADFLYGKYGGQAKIRVADLQAVLGNIDPGDLEEAIRIMGNRSLLRIGLAGDTIELILRGKLISEKGCVPEACLGSQFIAKKYRAAVKHIVVRVPAGDHAGGTAFFCSDFDGCLGTARHLVADGNQLLRIENEDGSVLARGPFRVRLAANDLDLALIELDVPAGLTPLRIDWDRGAVKELDEVIVVGYPPIAQHQPALVFSEGQVSAFARRRDGKRHSTIISRITEPGYSGGPVLSNGGLVVGVMEQENIFKRNDGQKSLFNGATPSHYFSELR